MTIYAGLTRKALNDKQPLSKYTDTTTTIDNGFNEDESTRQDRLERSILCFLAVIVGICLIGTMVSVGGFIFLRHKQPPPFSLGMGAASQRYPFMARSEVPVTNPSLDFGSQKEVKETTTTTSSTTTTTESPLNYVSESIATPTTPVPVIRSTTSWLEDLLSPQSASRDDKEPQETFSSMKKKLFTPTFITVKNQWSLESPPSAKQIFGYVKQAYHFMRNNRYFSQ